MCRARLHDYRATPARVAAVAPPVAVGFSLLGWLADHSGLAARWHQAAELALVHKGAAVVASVPQDADRDAGNGNSTTPGDSVLIAEPQLALDCRGQRYRAIPNSPTANPEPSVDEILIDST